MSANLERCFATSLILLIPASVGINGVRTCPLPFALCLLPFALPPLPLSPCHLCHRWRKVRAHNADGKFTETAFRTGDVIYRDPVTHWAENIGKTTIRLELVELKN